MRARWVALSFVGLSLSLPARATVVSWRAIGSVTSVQGTTGLLPLSAMVGDDFVLEFSYDDGASDTNASPDFGIYPILSLTVAIAGDSLDYVSQSNGEGRIAIQAHSLSSNLWGVTGSLRPFSDPSTDEARLNFFFPANTILSDALTPPPDPSGADVQFGLFSRDSPAPEEAFVVAGLDSITAVPEVAAPWSLVTAIATLAGLRGRWRPSPRATARPSGRNPW